MALEWRLYVRIKGKKAAVKKEEVDEGMSATKMEVDWSPSEKTDYYLIEIKKVEDSDKHVCPESILIMRRKPYDEVREIRRGQRQDAQQVV